MFGFVDVLLELCVLGEEKFRIIIIFTGSDLSVEKFQVPV